MMYFCKRYLMTHKIRENWKLGKNATAPELIGQFLPVM
jgi:hypothetical protein